jgi:hypothetical protein
VWSGAVGLVFDKWPSPLFEANLWNTTLAGLRVVLPLLLAGLLLTVWVVERGHGRVPSKLVRQLALAFTIVGFFAYFGGFNPNIRHPGFYQPDAFYHGYLGQKYRAELTDTSLVECTLAAEKVLGKAQGHATRYVYPEPNATTPVLASSVPAAADPTVCSKHFSDERWQSFRADITWFSSAVKAEEWAQLQRTRAEVTTPMWRMVVAPLVSAPASEARFRTLAFVEPVLHGLALLAVTWSFGPVAAAVLSVTWGCQPFLSFSGGATLLGNLWLAAWLVGLGCWRRRGAAGSESKGRAVAAGALVGFGMCLQPLSALALFPFGVVATARFRSGGRSKFMYPAAALVATLFVGGPGSSSFGGLGQYAEEVAQRRATPALLDIGLPALLSNHGAARYRFQRLDNSPDPAVEWSALRGAEHEAKLVFQWVAAGALMALACVIAWRRRSVETAALLGLSVMPLLAQPLSRDIGLLAVCLLGARRNDLAVPVLTALAGCALLANQTVFADDLAAALTAILWVTTAAVLLVLHGQWRPKLRAPRAVTATTGAEAATT